MKALKTAAWGDQPTSPQDVAVLDVCCGVGPKGLKRRVQSLSRLSLDTFLLKQK